MDADELHDLLREIAATDSIHASAHRDEIESRALLHRRHRRRVGTAIAVLGIAGLLVVMIVLVNGEDGSQSVRVPPAQSGNTSAPPPTPLAKCLSMEAQDARLSGWPERTVGMFDEGTRQSVLVPVETYCQQTVALEEQFFADHPPTASVNVYLDNGAIKVRPSGPVITNPTGPTASSSASTLSTP